MEVGSAASSYFVLLHRRRVTAAAARGDEPVGVCKDCPQAFSGKKPRLCKFSLANDLWLGRIDPLLWDANMTHEMCLAMARIVATKVVLRAGGAQAPAAGKQWDYVYQQTGYVGSSCFSTMATPSTLCSHFLLRSSTTHWPLPSAQTFR